jgi:uncharacterized protein
MTPLLILALTLVIVATTFLSGLFGMAGGLVLVGVLFVFLPLPTAMVLHAATQIASNLWRALIWRQHIRWRIVVAYMVGGAIALVPWSLTQFVPSTPVAMIFLGVIPLLVHLVPRRMQPNPESPRHGVTYGAVSMTSMLLTGVAGPLLDSFFLGGNLDRREIVATKGMCQIFGHSLKLAYFGGIIDQVADMNATMLGLAIVASLIGTVLAKRLLEAMSDTQYRKWAGGLITAISGYYVLHGSALLALANH